MEASLWQKSSELAASGKPFCLAVVAESSGSVPRRAGSTMLVMSDGSTSGTVGGGNVERLVRDDALLALRDGQPRLKRYDLDDPQGTGTDSICGGRITVFFMPQPARMTLHLFGAGHVARPTAHLAATVGYAVIVYDESDQYANSRNIPHAQSFAIGDPVAAARALSFGPRDAVVILTGSHEVDLEIVRAFKGKLPPYLGVIASEKKAMHFREQLKLDGWSVAEIAAVHAPIGLKISSRTPEEIAVSIVGEIISLRGPVE